MKKRNYTQEDVRKLQGSVLIEHTLAQVSVADFDEEMRNKWHMPQKYRELDIAKVPAVTVTTRTCGEFLTITVAKALFTTRPHMEVALKITPVATAPLIVTPLVHCREQPVISR